ncbi:hypothetical protein AAGV33_11120 [Flavobacterium sp. FBOR7N2.3]|uniref:Uncharacterized protein n=1 Tax=Flavobacterium magnesitis TaxID=3138077 RepID=A0ABV4TLX3_9FLAO
MDIQTRKIEFIQEFLKIQSEEAIAQFENLLKKRKNSDSEDAFKPMTIEELNKRIDKSEKDFKTDKYKSSFQLLLKYF